MDYKITRLELAAAIDHTLLKPDATEVQIRTICAEAIEYNFASVCINPYYVKCAAEELDGHTPVVCTVVGFPLGTNVALIKAKEAGIAASQGASEIDMVINIGALKDKNYTIVREDIESVVKAVTPGIVKVIIETCFLTREEKITACKIVKESGAHFVKTSTGFGSHGATVEDVALLKEIAGDDLKVKAAGGIKTLVAAMDMISAGADRIGASSGIAIINSLP
ncbi:MAG: deoxyribose-phosphate aldolase [Spirochaetales bacterium]|nr:deoxyribose-phosphate aldolase [Spirochaetales bacterium]